MVNGVNEKGEGFVTISAQGNKGTLLLGQLSPDEVRKHAFAYLEAAEAAEQDAAVFRVIIKLFPERHKAEQLAAMVITELRNSREGD